MHSIKLRQILILWAFALSSTNSANADLECILPVKFSKSVCKVLQINQKSIEKRQAQRNVLAQLQESYDEASQLHGRLINPENLQEAALVDEQLINEMALIAEERTESTYKAVASVGSLIVFSYVVKQMHKSTAGRSMLAKLRSHVNPFAKGGGLRTLASSAFVISLGMSLYNIYNIKRTNSQLNDLKDLIAKLNKIRDQAQNLALMTEELEEMETCFWTKVSYLEDEGLATIKDSKLVCTE